MTIEELLRLLRATQQKNLTPAQELILRQSWEGQTYANMAVNSIYEVDYLKTTAARLWEALSQLLKLPINKANFRSLIEQYSLPPDWQKLIEQESAAQPIAASLEYPNGPVPLNSRFYIERPPIEQYAYSEITKPGSVLRIKAPREMGKSSLMLRILDRAVHLGYQTVNVDLQQADSAILTNVDKFLRWFCTRVSLELNIKPNLDEFWDEDVGSKVSCTIYFKWYLLENIECPLLLALSEVDRIFEYPQLAAEFLPLLRSWYEEAQQVKSWQKLRLVVVYSTEVYVPLKINQSPFNIGLPLKLPEFTLEQVQELARRHGLNWQEGSSAKQLMALVGGHPTLVRLTLYHLVNPPQSLLNTRKTGELRQLLQNGHTEGGIYRDRLRRLLSILQSNPELAAAFKAVLVADREASSEEMRGVILQPILAYNLESLGLVKLYEDRVMVSCQLYSRYFDQQLLSIEKVSESSENDSRDGTISKLRDRVFHLEQENQQLQRLCNIDSLTELANRHCFDQQLALTWQELARQAAPLSLILCDIDFFKAFNDTYGHSRGDECLQQVSSAIQEVMNHPSIISSLPLAARYGGEEFAVILAGTGAFNAFYTAERIRQAIKTLAIPTRRFVNHYNSSFLDPAVVTISLGVACTIPTLQDSPANLVRAADEALYQSKQEGRDRTCVSERLNFGFLNE